MKEIKLKKLSEDEAVKIIRRRIGTLPLLSDDVIKKVFKHSDNNVRKMLKNCEEICKHAVNYGESKISDEMLKELFGVKKVVVKKVEPKKVEEKVDKKKVVKKVVKKKQKEESKEEKVVYKPNQPLNIGGSNEEMLNKGTDELLDEDQYY